MSKKSNRKGANGERELSKILSEIFQASFIRSDNSGAYIGGKNVIRKNHLSQLQQIARKADIIPPDHLPRFIIESKSYAEFRFHQLLQPGACPVLDTWIKQTIDIIDPGDQWFVAFKITLKGWYVAIPEDECSDYMFQNYCVYNSPHGRMRVTDLLSFFKTNRDLVATKAAPTQK